MHIQYSISKICKLYFRLYKLKFISYFDESKFIKLEIYNLIFNLRFEVITMENNYYENITDIIKRMRNCMDIIMHTSLTESNLPLCHNL